ncbi:hypothetical protein SAMN02745163_00844 [Clostridium cavendishii DSM 21758]|uniref:Lipoprotein n=1 Tax=Clostridium cavendishii DSM 21758 TaxID=1121302 RepID=A0A1M6EFS9_9CLOT|nr:hypothetical protein [Clostridium cavendishii]SHI84332.1 hypothetical protein SAMN02745163_00844 [Clostridium cavendishii DSM 21758]
MNKLFKNIIAIVVSSTLICGCSMNKTVTLSEDVKVEQLAINNNTVKVEEKLLDLNLKKDERFFSTFYDGDMLLGTIGLNDAEIIYNGTKEYGFLGVAKPNIYSLDKNGVFKETNKKVESLVEENNGKLVYSGMLKNYNEDNGNSYLNYIDYEKSNEKKQVVKFKDLYKELFNLNGSYGTSNFEEIVEGRENFIAAYSFTEFIKQGNDNEIISKFTDKGNNNKIFIKLLDMEKNKLYESDNINTEIIKIIYIKSIDSFIAIDKNANCYKLDINDNKIEFKKFSNIDIGDIGEIRREQVVIVDEDTIAITSLKYSENQIINYSFKNNKSTVLMKVNKDENVTIQAYYPKENLIVLSKSYKMKIKARDNREESSYKDVYLAQMKNNKIEIFHKLKNMDKENELYIWNKITVNRKGDELFIARYLAVPEINSLENWRTTYEFVNIKR